MIVLHIDRLVLRGVDRADAPAVQAALRAELQALLGDGSGPPALAAHGTMAVLRAAPVRLPPGADAAALGRAAAGGIAAASPARRPAADGAGGAT